MELYNYSISQIAKKIKDKEITIKEVLDSVYSRIDEVEKKIDGYITLTKESAYKRAEILQEKLDNGEDIGVLGGVPIAIKDNICTNGVKTTCASRMLEDFVPFYDATVVEKLENAGAIIVGKTNMDEFAMGSSTETGSQVDHLVEVLLLLELIWLLEHLEQIQVDLLDNQHLIAV